MRIITERLKAELTPYEEQTGDVREFIVRRVVVNDLERFFDPIRSEDGDILIACRVRFQRTVSDPKVFKFRDVQRSFTQYNWVPFVPKSLRLQANKKLEEKANKITDELKEIFKDGDQFRL